MQIEKKYSKDQILQMYLNEVPYGGTSWGVGAAAARLIWERCKRLGLGRMCNFSRNAASPVNLFPLFFNSQGLYSEDKGCPQANAGERLYYQRSGNQPILLYPMFSFSPKEQVLSPSFCSVCPEYSGRQIRSTAVEQGGLTVTTTLDLDLQKKAQDIVTDEIAKVENSILPMGQRLLLIPKREKFWPWSDAKILMRMIMTDRLT